MPPGAPGGLWSISPSPTPPPPSSAGRPPVPARRHCWPRGCGSNRCRLWCCAAAAPSASPPPVGGGRRWDARRKGGVGSHSVTVGEATVGALVVLNAVGDVFTLEGAPLTGGDPVPAGPAAV